MNSAAAPRIPSLDGIRALAIAMVVAGHLVQTNGSPFPDGPLRDRIISLAPLGVRVFFVLSGFLITRLLLTELTSHARIDLARFYLRRTLRIGLPYYALIAGAGAMAVAGWLTLRSADVVHALTFTVNYQPTRSWALGHAWSLAVEEQFYLLWPAALQMLGRQRGLSLAGILLVVGPLLRVGYFYFAPALIEEEVGYRLETVVDALAVGALLAGGHQALTAAPAWQRALASRWFALVPLVVLLVASTDQRWLVNLAAGITVQNAGIGACLAWALAWPAGVVGRVLNHPALVRIGLMSYSIYLWQQLFLNPMSNAWVARFPVNLVCAAAAAFASYHLVERPAFGLRGWLEQRRRIRTRPNAPQTP